MSSFQLSRTGGALLCVVIVSFSITIDGVEAVSNSSGAVSSSGGDEETSAVEKGMRPFFDMVERFLAVVQPRRLPEESWLNLSEIVKDGKFQTEAISDWRKWALYLVGFLVCVAVGVVYVIIMPITGLVFCCCRCAGRCGGKRKAHDPKNARCKRTTYCTLLLIVNTVALAGVVCVFLSNQMLYNKMKNENDSGPTGKLIHAANLINGFINTTIKDIEVLVLDVFLNGKDGIISDIKASANKAVEDVLNTLNATNLLQQSRQLVQIVNATSGHLSNVGQKLEQLSNQSNALSHNLTMLKQEVDQVCRPNCSIDTTKFAIAANFSGLNSLALELEKVRQAMGLDTAITQAESSITTIKSNVTGTVNSSIAESTSSMTTVEDSIRNAVSNISSTLRSEVTKNVDTFSDSLRDSQDDITKYSQYGWYVGLGVACALLLVVALYYVAILFGLCGERPGFGAQCCNTGTGANFLMAGVGFTFILGWLVMLVCIITFIVGGPLYTEVCRYFENHRPQDLQPYSDALMNLLDLQNKVFNGEDVNLSLVTILEDCHDNKALYSVLRLEHMENLTKRLDLTEVKKALDSLKNISLQIPQIDLLTADMNKSIMEFANYGVEQINFDAYSMQINKNMTQENLNTLAEQLRHMANSMPSPVLISVADQLNQLQVVYVEPMQQTEADLKVSLDFLQQQSKSGINQSTENLLQGLQQAENNFNVKKNQLVQEQMTALVDRVFTSVQKLVGDALYDVNNKIGKCHPVYASFYTATDAVCVLSLQSLNGVWFSIGWCLFFLVPCLIFAVKLAGLYRREHEEQDYDDPNFHLYSEGGKQDSIPLTSRQQQEAGEHGPVDIVESGRWASGVANGAYQNDIHMEPPDFPNYKGGAVNTGYQDDSNHPVGPPPYGAQHHPYGQHGALNGNLKSRNERFYPY